MSASNMDSSADSRLREIRNFKLRRKLGRKIRNDIREIEETLEKMINQPTALWEFCSVVMVSMSVEEGVIHHETILRYISSIRKDSDTEYLFDCDPIERPDRRPTFEWAESAEDAKERHWGDKIVWLIGEIEYLLTPSRSHV